MRKAWDLAVYLGAAAIVLVLTRPGSQGPGLVNAVGGALSNIGRAFTGQKASGGY